MNPKDGKAGSAVSPAEAKASLEADTADPGKMAELKSEQRQTKTGKYNPVKTQPHNAAGDGKSGDSESPEEKKSWIEIELIDDEKQPVPGVRYLVTLPDATVAEGTLDEKGFARIEGITPGSCKISFPDYDKSCWKAASGGGSSGGGGKSGASGGGGDAKSGGQGASSGSDGKSAAKDAGFGSGDEGSAKGSASESGKSGGTQESSAKDGGQEGSKSF